jgi:hypothetical protein
MPIERDGMTRICEKCKRDATRTSRDICLYCGGTIVTVNADGNVVHFTPPPQILAPLGGPEEKQTMMTPDASASSSPLQPLAPTIPVPAAEDIYKEKVPPLWLQILLVPFQTRGRIIGISIVAFIVFAILGLNWIIEKNRPKENEGKIVIDTSTGRRVGVPNINPGMPAPAPAKPPETNAGKYPEARASLQKIGKALEAYAAEHDSLPPWLNDDLRELKPYADTASLLKSFEGERLASYKCTASPNSSLEIVFMEARPKDADDLINWTVKYSHHD